MYGLHTVYNDSSSSELIDVILVPGISGNQGETWAPADTTALGFEEYLRYNIDKKRVSTYKYPLIGNEASIFSRSGLNREASRLLEAISQLDRARNQRIILAGHDVGGILIKQALIQAAFGDVAFRDTLHSTNVLFFIGCPHVIDYAMDLTPSLIRLLNLNEQLSSHPRALFATYLSAAIREINAEFMDVRAQLYILEQNIVSGNQDVQKRVFELYESQAQSMLVERQFYLELPLPHSELACEMPSGVGEVVQKHLADFQWTDLSKLRSSATFLSSLRRNRWDRTAIVHELPISQKEAFRTWESTRNAPFLAFQNAENVHFTCQAVFSQVVTAPSWSGLCHRFEFRHTDSQTKTVADLLCTVLKETLSRAPHATYATEELGWDLKDLFRLYRDVALANQADEAVWVLLNFDESIDHSGWLLDSLYNVATNSNMRLRVIFIGNSASTLRLDPAYTTFVDRTEPEQPTPGERSSAGSQTPPEFPVSTSEQKKETRTQAQDVPYEKAAPQPQVSIRKAEYQTLEVIQRNPRMALLVSELFQLFQKPNIGDKHKDLIMRWLSNLPGYIHPTAMQEQISNLSDARLKSTFRMMLSLDTFEPRDLGSTMEILELVALAFRPFTYLELANLEEARKDWETGYIPRVTHPSSIFFFHPGVLNLQDNEVQFVHPEFRRYLLSGDSLLLNLKGENLLKRHSHFARFCLEYLMSSHGRNRLEAATVNSDDVGAPECRRDFLSYAVRFWLKHAILACSEWTPQHNVAQKFLTNTRLLDLWGRVYWHRTSSAIRPSLERSGPLATMVEFAPDSTLQATISAHEGTEWLKGQYFNALLAAARVGKSDTVRFLLQHQSLDSEMLDLVLLAAWKSQDETTISIMTSEATETYFRSVGIPAALRKALEHGQDTVANQMLPRIAWETVDEDNKKSILSAAISGNNIELTTHLLERFQELQSQYFSDAILEPVRHGHAHLSGVLMAHLLKLLKKEEEEDSATKSPATSTNTPNGVENELTTADNINNVENPRAPPTGGVQVPVESEDTNVTSNRQEETTTEVPESSPEMSASKFFGDSYYVETVLNNAIDYGQHTVLTTLIEVLRENQSFPTSIRSLLESAIMNSKVESLSTLLESCQNIAPQSKQDMYELLDLAAFRGNVAVTQQLLQSGAVLDDESFPGVFRSAMQRAPADPEVVEYLIEQGRKSVPPDVFKDQLNTDSMYLASQSRSNAIVKLLIDAGVDFENRSIMGRRTPLYDAAYRGCVEIVETLIDAGADVNAFEDDDDGWYPVHAAFDNPGILKLLLDKGADANARAKNGDTALYLAVKWNYQKSVAELLEHNAELNYMIGDTTILVQAVDRESLNIAECLLEKGENPCHPATKAVNALLLHKCVKNRHVDLLKRLLLYDFDLEHVDDSGRTALNCLSCAENIPALRLLLQRGANLETQDKPWNDTPLSNAVHAGNVELLSFVISQGAKTNAAIGKYLDSTPLLLAAMRGSSPEIFDLLIKNNADTRFASTGLNGTIFQAVCQSHRETRAETLAYLLDNNLVDVTIESDWWGSNLNTACLMTDPAVVDTLIKRGADVDAVDKVGRRPVHFALYQTLEHVKTLCERDDDKNANLFAHDKMERNALHFAVISGQLDLVQHIIGLRPGLAKDVDCDGWTPLFWAVREALNWNVETSHRAAIIGELIKDGASIMDVVGFWAPYHVARYYGLDTAIMNLVTPTGDQIAQSDMRAFWTESLAAKPRVARKHKDSFCDICLLILVGVFYSCTQCRSFAMCFKCFRSRNRDLVHDPLHAFESRYKDDEFEGPAVAPPELYHFESRLDSLNSPVQSEVGDEGYIGDDVVEVIEEEDEDEASESDVSSF